MSNDLVIVKSLILMAVVHFKMILRTVRYLHYDHLGAKKRSKTVFNHRDICRRNAGSCEQQPNLAPIQCEHERVSLKMEIS